MDHKLANAILARKGFKLREGYQEEGVDWMLSKEWKWAPQNTLPNTDDVYGGILADEMGLGKTIQTISLMEANRLFNTLLVVPAPLIQQWVSEIKKFSSNLEVHVCYSGNYLGMMEVYSKPGVVIVTTYQTLVNHQELFGSCIWFRIILDEAHYIRNMSTRASSALMNLKGINKWALTGTPIQNGVSDIWTLLSFIGVKVSPKTKQELKNDTARMNQLVKQHMILRTKDQVGINFPKKTYNEVKIIPSEFETDIYKCISSSLDFELDDGDDSVEIDYSCELERLLRLRQVSIGVQIFLESYLKSEYKGKPIINTRLKQIIDTALTLSNCIIFCDFHSEMKYISEKLQKQGKRVGLIHGKISGAKRTEILQNQDDYDILVIQIYAGGTGLNLQRFNNVLINIPHYNPFIEEQAIGRVHRDGQTSDVNIYRFIDENSIDSRIREIQKIKTDIFNAIILKPMDDTDTSVHP